MKEIDESQVLFKNLLEIATGEPSPTIKDTAQRACDFLKTSNMSVSINVEDLSIIYTLRGRPIATTLGRFLGRVVGIGDDREKEKNHITQVIIQRIRQKSCDFNIVTGPEIVKAYNEEWGQDSCMTGKPEITSFYQEFPEHIALLKFEAQIGFSGNIKKVRARALLWQTTTGETAVDRIYPNEGWHIKAIQEWATAKGWVCRRDNRKPNINRSSFPNMLMVKLPTPLKWKDRIVDQLLYTDFIRLKVPYLDSFFYTDIPAGQTDEKPYMFWECTKCLDEIRLCTHPFPGARSRAAGINGHPYGERYCYTCGQYTNETVNFGETDAHVLCKMCKQRRQEKAAKSQAREAAEQAAQQASLPKPAEPSTVPAEELEEDTITL
jgi:hypothetical protein